MTADAATAIQLAEAYLASRNYGRAGETLRTALAADPRNVRLLAALARVELGQENHQAAEEAAVAALAADADDEAAIVVHCRVLEELGRLPESVAEAGRAASLYPHSTYALYHYARILDIADDPEAALPVVDRALTIDPLDPDLHSLRGDVHASLVRVSIMNLDAAEDDYREALRLDPQHHDALSGIAMLRFVKFRRWSAIDHFVGAARVDPGRSDVALWNIGMVLTRVLRRATWFSAIVSVAVITAFTKDVAGESTVWPRVVAGVWSVFLLVTYARVMKHQLPREVRRSVVRYRKVLFVRIVLLYAALSVGLTTAIVGPGVLKAGLSVVLLLAVPVVTIVGRLRDERLW